MKALPADYETRVYAGVLGKIIGVYAGRPFEQWAHPQIEARFGEIDRYVAPEVGVPLVVADDDISGTLAFVRAIEDCPLGTVPTSEAIGRHWLNAIIENRTILWWGGVGRSTEHTAYARLKAGIPAPESGSIARNGPVIAQQIGAQIFIEGWALLYPGDPDGAVALATEAARVSHDGEAVYGAQVVAAMVAGAFDVTRLDQAAIDTLIRTGQDRIPPDSIIAQVICDVFRWRDSGKDWRGARAEIDAHYGYDRWPGGCHMVPNHAVVITALAYCGGRFTEAMRVVNTCGYDTDCNAANVGAILGVAGGLSVFGDGFDWRGPVRDRLLVPTSDGAETVSDAAREADRIVAMAHRIRGREERPRRRYRFAYPGSVQGWSAGAWTPDGLLIEGESSVATWLTREQLGAGGYLLGACPTLISGQTVTAEFSSGHAEPFVIVDRGKAGLMHVPGTWQRDATRAVWTVPDTGGLPIAAIGLRGQATLRSLDWSGTPVTALDQDWRAWIQAADIVEGWPGNLTLSHAQADGQVLYGPRTLDAFALQASFRVHFAEAFGIMVASRGLRRRIDIEVSEHRQFRIIEVADGERRILAAVPMAVPHSSEVRIRAVVQAGSIAATLTTADGTMTELRADAERTTGGIGLRVSSGTAHVRDVRIDALP
ncbi:MAG: ADP-ribosylglycohydrolase family protein [Fimbriimonadaceae bacterium]|nr:ADP-ribosylglycohydrolase family protein [Fimbriimonadaceae bacterium]